MSEKYEVVKANGKYTIGAKLKNGNWNEEDGIYNEYFWDNASDAEDAAEALNDYIKNYGDVPCVISCHEGFSEIYDAWHSNGIDHADDAELCKKFGTFVPVSSHSYKELDENAKKRADWFIKGFKSYDGEASEAFAEKYEMEFDADGTPYDGKFDFVNNMSECWDEPEGPYPYNPNSTFDTWKD